MSEEVTDNVAPVEENVAPVQEAPVTSEPVVEQAKINKFGELLSYASDDIKDAKTWDKFKDVDLPTALKAIVDMDKWTGKRGDIPQDWNDEKAVKEFYSKIGVPENAEGYEYAFDEETKTALGDSAEPLAGYINEMKALGLKHNIPQKAMDGFFTDAMAHEMSLRNQAGDINKEQLAANQKMINDEWGKEFDSMSQAVQSLEKHYNITPEEADLIESNPQTLILLGRIAKDLDEKGQVGNVFSQTKIGLADELSDVKGEITSILAKNGRNVNDPALDSLLKRKDRLMEKIG